MIVSDPIFIGKKKDIKKLSLFLPADGKKGSTTRVWRNFPLLDKWSGHAIIYLLDPVLADNPGKVEEYIIHSGQFIGLLTFRPRRGGYYGRYKAENFNTNTK